MKQEFSRGIFALTMVFLPITLNSMGNGSFAGFSTTASTRVTATTRCSPGGILVEGFTKPGVSWLQSAFGVAELVGRPLVSAQPGVAEPLLGFCVFCEPGIWPV